MKQSVKWIAGVLCATSLTVLAQTTVGGASPLSAPVFQLTGTPFHAAQLQGKVHVVFYWSTSCAICRDSLPELRANQNGWRNKPFALVTVNVDKHQKDWQAYERIVQQTQMPDKSLIALWQDSSTSPPAKLPLTLLVDSKGKIVSRIEGRVAPEVWDSVAELLL